MVSKSTSETKIQEETDGTEDFEIYKAGETTTNTDVSFYEYNLWNQMSKSIEGDKTILYKYNGEGYRVEKSVNEEITRYLYEYDKVVLEVDGAGLQKAKNIYGTNLIARESQTETAYYMYNGHSDVTALIDATGNILSTYYYDAFGNLTEETGEEDNPYRYAGYRYDEETDLYYLNARYYNSKVARFTTEDTFRGFAENPLSLNYYTYCTNNPIMYYDYTGHWGGKDGTEDDSSLSAAQQAAIVKLTKDFYDAKDEDKEEIHQKANKIRSGEMSPEEVLGTKKDKDSYREELENDIKDLLHNEKIYSNAKMNLLSSKMDTLVYGNDKKSSNQIMYDIYQATGNGTFIIADPYAKIRKQAKEDIQDMLTTTLLEKYKFKEGGFHFLVEDTYVSFLYDDYKLKKHSANFRESWLDTAIIGASVYDSYKTVQQYAGPLPPVATAIATAAVTVAKMAGYDDGMPDYTMALKTIQGWHKNEKETVIALAKLEYVLSSDYKYLISDGAGRRDFKKQLNYLKIQIQEREILKYNNNYEKTIYKQTMINYIDKIYSINENYNESINYLQGIYNEIENEINQIDNK